MSFKTRDLSVLAYANGFTLWHYKSGDTASSIASGRYFLPARDLLRSGDMIIANSESTPEQDQSVVLLFVRDSTEDRLTLAPLGPSGQPPATAAGRL